MENETLNGEKIINIFYTQVVPEALGGRVDCYIMDNIGFNLTINDKIITKGDTIPYEGVLIPTLSINNKKLFDSLLVEYVQRAISFYSNDDFDFLNYLPSDMDKELYQIKYIICSLFANASISDFEQPIAFLKSRIAMFDNKILPSSEIIDLGYYDSVKANIILKEEISPIKAETPYRITGYLQFADGYILTLPEIYAGKTEDKYYLYGIQKTSISDKVNESPYLKQIRKGLIAKINGAPEHYFLAAMLFLSFCSDKEIEVIPYLIERWNAKRIALIEKNKRNNNMTIEEISTQQEKLQSGITDNLIRYFSKLEDVTNGMEFTALPFEFDSSLHINISEELQSRSVLFNEVFMAVKEYKKQESPLKK